MTTPTPSGSEEDLQKQDLQLEKPSQSTSTIKEDPLFFSTNRSYTDVRFLVIQGIATIISLCLAGYCTAYSDLHKFSEKCDGSGNICDTTNDGIRDATDITVDNPGSVELMSRDFSEYSSEITTLCCIAAVTSYMLLFLLRRSAKVFFCVISIGGIIVSIILLVVLWKRLSINRLFIMPAIASTLVAFGLLITAVTNSKAAPLAMRLFDETGKYTAGASNPFFSAALTFVSLSIIWWSWLYFARSIESAAVPVGNFAVGCARWCNVIVMLWMVQFIYECQCFVLAGSISSCFFNRENTSASGSVYSSTIFFINYHLGTVSKNSLVLMFVQLLHIIFFLFRMIIFIRVLNLLCICFEHLCFTEIPYFETHLKFLTRSVPTITAMNGYSMQKSISRLQKFWKENTVLPLIPLTVIGGFMLFLAKIFVVIITILISRFLINIPSIEAENNKWNELFLLGIIALLAYLIANSILRVYEMSANTIVVCYCVDCHINNGTTRPYFMTAAFMEFIEVCKTSLEENLKEEAEKIIKKIQKEDTKNNEYRTSRRKPHHHRHHHNRQQGCSRQQNV